MRMMMATALLLALGATPAAADWQMTTWGMTQDQLAAAVGEENIERISEPRMQGASVDRRASAVFQSGQLKFRTNFYFDNTGLMNVSMTLIEGQCYQVLDALAGKYGPPIRSQSAARGAMWFGSYRSDPDNLAISVTTGNTCLVTYQPLRTANGSAL